MVRSPAEGFNRQEGQLGAGIRVRERSGNKMHFFFFFDYPKYSSIKAPPTPCNIEVYFIQWF